MTVRLLQGIDSLGRRYTSRAKERPCANCGQQIKRRGTTVKFCSVACRADAYRGVLIPPEVLAKRRPLTGPDHQHWKGSDVSVRGGRTRALRAFPEIGPCCRCGATPAERHHKDGNTANNEPTNIEPLCRRCHMEVDGRLASLRENPGRGSACR